MTIQRGDFFFADLNPYRGSEQGGQRPVLIIQNDVGNKFSPTVIVAVITSKITKAKLPTHVEINSSTIGLIKNSVITLEQIRTIDKSRLIHKLGTIEPEKMEKVDEAILKSLGMSKASTTA